MKKKTILFVDTENVNNYWMQTLDYYANRDLIDVRLFYTEPGPRLSYDDLRQIYEKQVRLSFILCVRGTNALDFQLATQLGCDIAKEDPQTTEFVIVSNDHGFDPVVKYWKTNGGYTICRRGIIKEMQKEPVKRAPEIVVLQEPKKELSREEIIGKYHDILLSNHQCVSPEDASILANILYKTMAVPPNSRMITTYSQMRSTYGAKKGATSYHQTKKTLSEISKTGPFPS